MPSRRHNAAIDSSPRRPSSTMRIFSSAPYCLRVARRMSFATCSAEAFCVPAFCLIFAPFKGYDEPEILPSQLSRFCLIGADAGQDARLLGAHDRIFAVEQKAGHAGDAQRSAVSISARTAWGL